MDKTFWNIMQIGGLITSCLAGARLYEIGEDSFFYGFVLGIGALMFAAKYMGEEQEREMKKFNWNEFKNKDNKIAVHCKTEEEAKDLCKQMHEHGMKWCNGESYLKNTNYMRNEGTCYYGSGEYSTRDFAEKYNYKILEWSDYMQKEFAKADLKDGMVVEYRDGDRRLVIDKYLIGKKAHYELSTYNENLEDGYPGLTIMKVFKIRQRAILERILDDDNLELIWERTEPKKMTVEEMRQKLEELTGEEIEIEIV